MNGARYEHIARSAGGKKFITATALADRGDSQALWLPGTTPFANGIAVGAASLHNRSGGTVQCGLAVRLADTVWTAGQVTAAGAYTDDTTDAQDVGAGDFQLHDRTDSGSGFLVSSDVPFNILGIVQSAAGDQGAVLTLIVEAWIAAAWTDITTSLLISDALIANGIGEKVLCWPIPSDWTTGGSGTGVPSGHYNLRVRYTTGGAGTADPTASQLYVGVAKMLLEGLTDNSVSALVRDHDYHFPPQGNALFPVFSTASRASIVEADVRAY